MGGAEHRVTGVAAQSTGSAEPVSDGCPALPSRLRPVSLDGGIWVGSTRRELTRVPGEASGSRDDWLVFFCESKVRGPYRGPGDIEEHLVDFDESSLLEVRIVEERVVALDATKGMSD